MLGGAPTPPPPPPYDAQVEYLASAGTGAYIDSGIECTGDLSVVVRAYWTTNENKAFMGGIASNGSGGYFRHHLTPYYTGQGYGLYWYQNGTSGTPTVSGGMNCPANTWSIISVNADTGTWYYERSGVSRTGSITPLSGTITTGRNYGIFARIMGDGTLQSRPVRISLVRLTKGGVKLREFIPVRVGQVGYLYDNVSGQLFGNAGTGSFTYGNDITP